MNDRGDQEITRDAENRPVSITSGGNTTTFVYDGDGNRVKKLILREVEGTEEILYINKYHD